MLPPLSAAAFFGENLVGVVLRNVFGFAPILWSFGDQTPAPGNGEYPRPKFCSASLQPKSRGVASTCGNFISSRDLRGIARPATIGTGPIDYAWLASALGLKSWARTRAPAILTDINRPGPG